MCPHPHPTLLLLGGGSWHSFVGRHWTGSILKQNYLYPQLGKHNAVSLASISFLDPQI